MYYMDNCGSDLSSCKNGLLLEVLNGDLHLKSAVVNDIAKLENLVAQEHNILGMLPICRDFARDKKISSGDNSHIASFCCGDIEEHEFEKISISNYFCQKLHEVDLKLFMGKAKKYFYGLTHEEISSDLDRMLIKLGGDDFRHINTTRWSVSAIGC